MECSITQCLNSAAVEVKRTQVLAPDERVARQFRQVVAVQVELSGVHRDAVGQVGVEGTGAFDDVGRPSGIVIAITTLRARHFAIASVEIAAVAQSEAVRLVGAEEFFWSDVN